jgi:hypothetical protein
MVVAACLTYSWEEAIDSTQGEGGERRVHVVCGSVRVVGVGVGVGAEVRMKKCVYAIVCKKWCTQVRTSSPSELNGLLGS